MTAAVLGLGTTLQVSNGASPQVFTTIAEVLSFDGPDTSADDIDVTNLDSTSKEYISAIEDTGNVTMELNWSGTTEQKQLRDDVSAGTARNYKITWQNSPKTIAAFAARVTNFTLPSTGPETQIKGSATLKLSGSITWTN